MTHQREGEAGHNVGLDRKLRDTSRSPIVSTKLQAIAQQAIQYPEMVFTTLAHHIDVAWWREAYRLTNKSSAAGIDGVTAQEYEANLEEKLCDLHERLKSGWYIAPPVERVWLEREDGRKRPIGKWKPSMNQSSMTSPTAFGQAIVPTKPCTNCGSSVEN